tara:strand:+ start:193 stop:621 length:429 start_codon:yes stop_codon:yes gene_type:complete
MTPNEIEKFEKVNYVPLEPEQLTWWEWIWGRAEPEIDADPNSKVAKFKVTQQIKTSANSHVIMKKHQADTAFDHTQSVVKTDQKMEDKSNVLPSPYQQVQECGDTVVPLQIQPQFPVEQTLHPSIAQIRNKRFKTVKDDIHI